MLVVCLYFMFHRQPGHLETAPPFTVPCEGCEARFSHHSNGNQTPCPCEVVHYTNAAPRQLHSCLYKFLRWYSYEYLF